MSDAIVFAERAIAPGRRRDLARSRSSTWRAASPRSASSTSRPCRRASPPSPALEAWAGDDVSSWRLELGRFYDDHARVHLRRDPGTAALLASLRADGVRLAAYGQGPREASAATLAFLGLDRRLDAIVLEPAGDGYCECLEALGVSEAAHVTSRDQLAKLAWSSGQ